MKFKLLNKKSNLVAFNQPRYIILKSLGASRRRRNLIFIFCFFLIFSFLKFFGTFDKTAASYDSFQEKLAAGNGEFSDLAIDSIHNSWQNFSSLIDSSFDNIRIQQHLLVFETDNLNNLVIIDDQTHVSEACYLVDSHVGRLFMSNNSRSVVSSCPLKTNCGGLADRLMGLSTAAVFAVVTNRRLKINWSGLVKASALFDLQNVEETSAQEPFKIDALNLGGSKIDALLTNNTDWNSTFGSDPSNIEFISNRGIISRLYKQELYAGILQQVGIDKRRGLACLLDSIIKPRSHLYQLVKHYTALLAQPSIFPIGVQIRTGDKSMRASSSAGVTTPEAIEWALQIAQPFFKCAFELARSKKTSESQFTVIFLVTDSAILRDVVSTHPSLSSHILTTGLPIGHFDKTQRYSTIRTAEKAERVLNAAQFAVIENWILAQIKYKIISQGGFGKIAALRAEKYFWPVDKTTVLLTPRNNTDLKRLRKLPDPQDCSDPSSFVSFDDLVSDWSLG